jgi:NADH-quinone oxidoreductase subunit E
VTGRDEASMENGNWSTIKKRYPAGHDAALVMPMLTMIQNKKGIIEDEDIKRITQELGVPEMQVKEVLSWYTLYTRQKLGRYVVQVCRNISCSLRGAERILEHLEKKLAIRPGETDSAGRFTLLAVECLGSCGTAPVMQINETYYENLTPEKINAILDNLP